MVLTWRAGLLAAIAVVAVAIAGHWLAFVIATGLLVLVITVDLVLCPSPAKITVRRSGDTSIRLGEEATVSVLLTNHNRRAIKATVRDAWTPSAGARNGITTLTIPARQRRLVRTTLLPTRRGDRPSGPVIIRSYGPLRIAGRQHAHHGAPWQVRALPPFNSRKHLPSRVARLRELDGRSSILQRGQGTEFDSLREYVPGDDVRSIDWRATARSTTVVVKTWRPERDRHVLIVLESGRTSAGRVGDQPKLDHSMDAALLLAALASRAGDRVDLLVVDREVRASVVGEPASTMLNSFVNAMAGVESVLVEADHRKLVAEVMTRVAQRSLVVILTGLDTAAITDGLLGVIGPVRRKHRIVIGAVSDPRIEELLSRREEPGDAYAAAAAEVDIARRERLVRRLRDLGISIVQSPPDTFAPALADHYLALKKAGQL